MDEKTFYHELLSNGLTKLKDINNGILPLIEEYKSYHAKGHIPCEILAKLCEPFKNLEKEVVTINKLIRDIREDCKDYYEGLR